MSKNPTIQVLAGSYRGQDVSGQQFQLVQAYQTNSRGGYIVVRGDRWNKQLVRIQLDAPQDYQLLNSDAPEAPVAPAEPQLTDQQLMDQISHRFQILEHMTQATIAGDIRALIVQGPPGVGKSHGVLTQMERASMFDEIAGRPPRYEVIKGATTSLGLYATLYKFSDPGCVLVFDDCDSVFNDELSLNICKAALDSGRRRRIFWNSDSALLRREGIPDSFDFRGSVIFITNVQFDNIRSRRMQDHLAALQSRCHFVDLGISNNRGKLLRIQQLLQQDMLADYGFDQQVTQQLFEFIQIHEARWREISLRLVIKLADLRKIMPSSWQQTAEVTLMR